MFKKQNKQIPKVLCRFKIHRVEQRNALTVT